jgi:hypothetical protein
MSEADALPGGRLALALFWFGASLLFVGAVVMLLFQRMAPPALGFSLLPAWGLIALVLGIRLRTSRSQSLVQFGKLWLFGLVAILMFLEQSHG